MSNSSIKKDFETKFKKFVQTLNGYICDNMQQWTIKGFIDIDRNIYPISNDTKIISKILEIHIFPLIANFAEEIGYKIVLPDCQNYYPDISFVSKNDDNIKFAVDFKSTYRKANDKCNGFTLGSHGEYFQNRNSTKNIQFPYKDYLAHFCLGIIYTRTNNSCIDEIKTYKLENLTTITSVIKDIEFFFCEKWKIASDLSGSGNTANIGSVTSISNILNENGVFKEYGERMFDDYWMAYGEIPILKKDGTTKKITKLKEFLAYRGIV